MANHYDVLIYRDQLDGEFYASPGEVDMGRIDRDSIRWRNDTEEGIEITLPPTLGGPPGPGQITITPGNIESLTIRQLASNGVFRYTGRGVVTNRRVKGLSDPRIRT